jgi:hypothetical protein
MKMANLLWRFLARVLPVRWRRELPGWGYLELFVLTFATTPGNGRLSYLAYAFQPDQPYTAMLIRAGGVHAGFRLILGPVPPPNVAELFAAPPGLTVEQVKTADIANNLVVSLNFIECPAELSPHGSAA